MIYIQLIASSHCNHHSPALSLQNHQQTPDISSLNDAFPQTATAHLHCHLAIVPIDCNRPPTLSSSNSALYTIVTYHRILPAMLLCPTHIHPSTFSTWRQNTHHRSCSSTAILLISRQIFFRFPERLVFFCQGIEQYYTLPQQSIRWYQFRF